MAGSPQHATLVAATVTTITFDTNYDRVEVLNVDGAATVYFRADGVTPTVGGTGCDVLPATIGSPEASAGEGGIDPAGTVVKLISSGTPSVSVRGLFGTAR